MNAVDIGILAILGLSVLWGLYRGFVASVASLGGCLLSLGLTFWLNPKLVAWIQSNPDLLRTLMSYTDAGTRIGDRTLAATPVAELTSNMITEIINRVQLPAPLDQLLKNNLEKQVFQPSNLTQVGDYVSQTIVGSVLNVVCFVLLFLAMLLVVHFVLAFLKAVFRFPVLKQINALAGGVFGLLRGALICLVLFALMPFLQTVIPIQGFSELVQESTLAPFFNSRELILAVINRHL